MAQVLPGLDALFDETKRVEVAPKALPVMKKMADLLDEAIGMVPQACNCDEPGWRFQP